MTEQDGRDTGQGNGSGHGHGHGNGPRVEGAYLAAERFDVYRIALEFQALAAQLVPTGHSSLRDQLDRASVSIVCNIAEGAGRTTQRDKAQYYAIARGSAAECAALLDVLRVRRLAPAEACSTGREQLVRIVQMITRLEKSVRSRK